MAPLPKASLLRAITTTTTAVPSEANSTDSLQIMKQTTVPSSSKRKMKSVRVKTKKSESSSAKDIANENSKNNDSEDDTINSSKSSSSSNNSKKSKSVTPRLDDKGIKVVITDEKAKYEVLQDEQSIPEPIKESHTTKKSSQDDSLQQDRDSLFRKKKAPPTPVEPDAHCTSLPSVFAAQTQLFTDDSNANDDEGEQQEVFSKVNDEFPASTPFLSDEEMKSRNPRWNPKTRSKHHSSPSKQKILDATISELSSAIYAKDANLIRKLMGTPGPDFPIREADTSDAGDVVTPIRPPVHDPNSAGMVGFLGDDERVQMFANSGPSSENESLLENALTELEASTDLPNKDGRSDDFRSVKGPEHGNIPHHENPSKQQPEPRFDQASPVVTDNTNKLNPFEEPLSEDRRGYKVGYSEQAEVPEYHVSYVEDSWGRQFANDRENSARAAFMSKEEVKRMLPERKGLGVPEPASIDAKYDVTPCLPEEPAAENPFLAPDGSLPGQGNDFYHPEQAKSPVQSHPQVSGVASPVVPARQLWDIHAGEWGSEERDWETPPSERNLYREHMNTNVNSGSFLDIPDAHRGSNRCHDVPPTSQLSQIQGMPPHAPPFDNTRKHDEPYYYHKDPPSVEIRYEKPPSVDFTPNANSANLYEGPIVSPPETLASTGRDFAARRFKSSRDWKPTCGNSPRPDLQAKEYAPVRVKSHRVAPLPYPNRNRSYTPPSRTHSDSVRGTSVEQKHYSGTVDSMVNQGRFELEDETPVRPRPNYQPNLAQVPEIPVNTRDAEARPQQNQRVPINTHKATKIVRDSQPPAVHFNEGSSRRRTHPVLSNSQVPKAVLSDQPVSSWQGRNDPRSPERSSFMVNHDLRRPRAKEMVQSSRPYFGPPLKSMEVYLTSAYSPALFEPFGNSEYQSRDRSAVTSQRAQGRRAPSANAHVIGVTQEAERKPHNRNRDQISETRTSFGSTASYAGNASFMSPPNSKFPQSPPLQYPNLDRQVTVPHDPTGMFNAEGIESFSVRGQRPPLQQNPVYGSHAPRITEHTATPGTYLANSNFAPRLGTLDREQVRESPNRRPSYPVQAAPRASRQSSTPAACATTSNFEYTGRQVQQPPDRTVSFPGTKISHPYWTNDVSNPFIQQDLPTSKFPDKVSKYSYSDLVGWSGAGEVKTPSRAAPLPFDSPGLGAGSVLPEPEGLGQESWGLHDQAAERPDVRNSDMFQDPSSSVTAPDGEVEAPVATIDSLPSAFAEWMKKDEAKKKSKGRKKENGLKTTREEQDGIKGRAIRKSIDASDRAILFRTRDSVADGLPAPNPETDEKIPPNDGKDSSGVYASAMPSPPPLDPMPQANYGPPKQTAGYSLATEVSGMFAIPHSRRPSASDPKSPGMVAFLSPEERVSMMPKPSSSTSSSW